MRLIVYVMINYEKRKEQVEFMLYSDENLSGGGDKSDWSIFEHSRA